MDAIIIEDEALAAINLEKMIAKIDHEIKILKKFETVRDSVTWLKHNAVDVIFLDVRLSDGLSFAIFEQIKVETPVIFTTAYDQYAVKVFEQNSVDYLLKPIKEEELKRAIDKLCMLYEYYGKQNVKNLIDYSNIQLKFQYKERFLVRILNKMKYIHIKEVAYFYSNDGYTQINTKNLRSYPIEESLDKLEHQLNPDDFFRINRKFIVNINSINEMNILSNRSIKINLGQNIPEECIVSISRLSKFKKWLNK